MAVVDTAHNGPSGQRVVTISGLRIEVGRFGELKIGHRIFEPEEADKVADTIREMGVLAREVRTSIRRPRRERNLGRD